MKSLKTLAQLSTLTLSLMALSLPNYAQEQAATIQASTSQVASPININQASAEELASLTLVGEKKAQEIVKDRELNGPFGSIEELTRVKGIGDSTIERNRSRLLVAQ
ncbi:ComEA family DNA-binding protein [Oceaniserpentilla sp. 4NH20-0058]|uniref:ComEA family DNA-binding protein n=1 Tax=Oceaniserpentilla sp. 4NH20-0058 TaxID=3127660 RepID=UPI003103E4A3